MQVFGRNATFQPDRRTAAHTAHLTRFNATYGARDDDASRPLLQHADADGGGPRAVVVDEISHHYASSLCSPKAWINGCCIDAGRRIDVMSSLLGAIVPYAYGLWRLRQDVSVPTTQGVAATLVTVLPFVYGTEFLISAVYHVAVPFPVASSVLRELDILGIQVSLGITTLAVVLTLCTMPDGTLAPELQPQVWVEPIATTAVISTAFLVQRLFVPPQATHQPLNDPSQEDFRHVHSYRGWWNAARSFCIFLLATGWLVQSNLFVGGLRKRDGLSPPPVFLVQLLSLVIFLMAAFVDVSGLAALCAPSVPDAFAHTTWHLVATIAMMFSLINIDFLLLRWQLDGPWTVPQSWW